MLRRVLCVCVCVCVLWNNIHVQFSWLERLVITHDFYNYHLSSTKIRRVGLRAQLSMVVDIMQESVALVFVYP